MAKLRTFIAVETPPDVVGRALKLAKRLTRAATAAEVKWVAPENLHWTVKFLGDVDPRDLAEICRALAEAARSVAPFRMEVAGAGAFPNAARPRTLWLGAGAGGECLVSLAEAVDAAMTKIGFRREGRRYEPHLTIGRVRNGGPAQEALGELLAGNAGFEGGSMEVDEVVLFSSELRPEGPIYEALERAELTG
ncbi:MAG: RNA 2',3'-cyclic phosphodiesterase [Planctomycetota bacterium]|nr:MAG: RNA 2',3'-cyclic phosphodiesterase [Planctomycetota bacterium]